MKRDSRQIKEEAVSPVIGVMLMIVVTIIIAAAVSGLAGDMDLDENSGPNVILESEIDYDGGCIGTQIRYQYYACDTRNNRIRRHGGQSSVIKGTHDTHGILLTHKGGDPFDLKDLQMSVYSNNMNIQVDYDTKRPQTSNVQYQIGENITYHGRPTTRYIHHVEVLTPGYDWDDVLASIGDQRGYFHKLNPETADDTIIRSGDQFKVFIDSGGATGWVMKVANAGSDEAEESFAIEAGSGNGWILSHKPSGAYLATGEIYFPDVN